jgi:hypothetical protein
MRRENSLEKPKKNRWCPLVVTTVKSSNIIDFSNSHPIAWILEMGFSLGLCYIYSLTLHFAWTYRGSRKASSLLCSVFCKGASECSSLSTLMTFLQLDG